MFNMTYFNLFILLWFLGTQLQFPTVFGILERKMEIYTVDANNSLEVDMILNHHSDPSQASTLFLVICSSECIEDILTKVI